MAEALRDVARVIHGVMRRMGGTEASIAYIYDIDGDRVKVTVTVTLEDEEG